MLVAPPGPVCVTGASGFIAAHIVAQLLEQGYDVRGTVRSLSKPGKYDFLTSLPGADKHLTLVEGELNTPGSYDEAVLGCVAVIHTASPYVVDVDDPQRDLVDPAVNGTTNVLDSVMKAPSVQRVVLTSSMAAISDEPDPNHTFTEDDWNEKSSLTRNAYYYSKTLAERAAWDFVAEHAPAWDLVVINPYMTIGPSLSPGLNTSNGILAGILTGTYPVILALSWGFVDVRDVARAHILAMQKPEARGRHICAAEIWSLRQTIDCLHENGLTERRNAPSWDLSGPIGTALATLASYLQGPGTGSYLRTHLGRDMLWSNDKVQRELGLQFTPIATTLPSTVHDLQKWGHLK